MAEKIRVLRIEPEKNPEEITIPNTLKALQEEVGGYIEVAPLERIRDKKGGTTERIDIVCNEEGKIRGLKPNRVVSHLRDIICGTFLIVAVGDEDFISLTDAQVKRYQMLYRYE